MRWLPWLADAPMFIDGPQVAEFHDAIIRPRYKTMQIEMSKEWSKEVSANIGGDISAGLPKWFPWLKAEVSLSGELATTRSNTEGSNVVFEPIVNPSRQLVELSLHYLATFEDRIWVQVERDWKLPDEERIKQSPRMLAVIDFSPRTKFIPMAAELDNGHVVLFFKELEKRFKEREGIGQDGSSPPPYPDDMTEPGALERRREYWNWFADLKRWHAQTALEVVEECIGKGGRPRWVDYTVPVTEEDAVHLHVVGHGDIDTGVFAYNLVKRGWNYGLRVVGRVKTSPDINVLAIYET